MSSERIVMAAWRENGAIYAVERPGRHHTVFHRMGEVGRVSSENPLACESGFITSEGRYVDRKEGCIIAKAAGQIIEKHGGADTLFSEDMW